VSLLRENKIAAEGKTTAPEDFAFTAWRLPHSLNSDELKACAHEGHVEFEAFAPAAKK
jgi:hypothetical protein